jgi:hypothetical protein
VGSSLVILDSLLQHPDEPEEVERENLVRNKKESGFGYDLVAFSFQFSTSTCCLSWVGPCQQLQAHLG